jgi:hypothetical protein
MKKTIFWACICLALFAAVAFTGCTGDDGKAYGSYTFPSGTILNYSGLKGSTGGFPSNAIAGVEYSFNEGNYYFYYYLEDSYYYYPTYLVSYTVKYNKGKLFSDGADKHFEIYCNYYGASATGLSRVGAAPNPKTVESGQYSETFANDSMTVTVKVQRIDRSAFPKENSGTEKK